MAENNRAVLREEEEVHSKMEDHNWRANLTKASRLEIISKLTNCLKKHLPISGPEGLAEIKKIAARHEEKIYTSSTSQADYVRKVSLKIFAVDVRPQIPFGAPLN